MKESLKNLIPSQEEGAESNTTESVELEKQSQALAFYEKVQQRLLDVNHWHEIAGILTADFALCDEQGNKVDREPKEGDHFRINIPAPGNTAGDGYDWVRVEKITRQSQGAEESLLIQVRPCSSPVNEEQDIAHFFTNDSTSSFIVSRKDNTITAAVYGRNEKPNTDAESITDKTRNAVVATAAISLFSKFQWKSLVHGLLKQEE